MYSAPLSLQTAETKWYRVTGSWALLSQLSKILGNWRTLVWGQQTSSWVSYYMTVHLPCQPQALRHSTAIKQKQVEQASTKGCTGPTTQQVFWRKPSFLHCLSSTASPQAKTLLAGQAQLCCFCSCTDASTGCNHADWNPTFELLPHSIK